MKKQTAIPKIIHYSWFGGEILPEKFLKCIESWKKHNLDFEIIEWNEKKFDIHSTKFTRYSYEHKKWAFLADYIRFYALHKYGGIYLDTDMYIVRPFDFLDYDMVLALDYENRIEPPFIAGVKDNVFFKDILSYYQASNKINLTTVPLIITKIFRDNEYKYKNQKMSIKTFNYEYFYYFRSANDIHKFKFDMNSHNAPPQAYGVHLWNYSWETKTSKTLKKLRIQKLITSVLDFLGIKNRIKKMMGLPIQQ